MKAIEFKRKQKLPDGRYEEVIKKYYPVAERVKEFYKLYPNGQIKTKIIEKTDDSILIKAWAIGNKEDESLMQPFGTGHAFEKQSWGTVNERSMVENCETSAVGRALAFLGIGVSDDIASAEEMAKVQETVYDASESQYSMIEELLKKALIKDIEIKEIQELCEQARFTAKRAEKCIKYLQENQAEKSLDKQLDDKLK